MASRNFSRKQALEKEIKELHVEVAIAAAGAPTLTHKLGVTSVTRDSAGVYIITLDDKYVRLCMVHVKQVAAVAQDLTFQIEAETVSTTKQITIQCKAGAVETDPSSGSKLLIKLELKNSSVK